MYAYIIFSVILSVITLNSNLFKTRDYNITLSQLSWGGTETDIKWAYYDVTSLNATKILSVSIKTYSLWKNTDYINVCVGDYAPNSIMIISNTTSFLSPSSYIVVRVHYV